MSVEKDAINRMVRDGAINPSDMEILRNNKKNALKIIAEIRNEIKNSEKKAKSDPIKELLYPAIAQSEKILDKIEKGIQ